MDNFMELCSNHEEREQIFCLAQMLSEAGLPFFFIFFDDMRPTPFDHEGGDPESDIDWNQYHFLIEIGRQAGYGLSQLSITFNSEGDETLLELLDMRGAADKPDAKAEDGKLTRNLTAEDAMQIIEKFFDEA